MHPGSRLKLELSRLQIDAMHSKKDGFDVAMVPGARAALQDVYRELRAAEEEFYAEVENSPEAEAALQSRACPLCGIDESLPFLAARGLRIVRCQGCSHVYSKDIYRSAIDAWQYEASDKSLWQAYLKVKRHPVLAAIERLRNRYFIDICERFQSPGSMVDVGSGNGSLLFEAARRGWQVQGLDPNPIWQEVTSDLGIRPKLGWFPTDLPKGASFDVISMLDVLEHMVDPIEFLRETQQFLNPGGALFIQVPNLNSLLMRLEGAANHNWCPSHWSYFDRDALECVAQRAGYECLWVETVISEIDKIWSMDKARVFEVANSLGEAKLASVSELTTDWMHANLLGFKLVGVLRRSPRS